MKKLVSLVLLIGVLAGSMPVRTSFAMRPSKQDLTVSYEDNSFKKEARKYKRRRPSDAYEKQVFECNKEIVIKYRDLFKAYKKGLYIVEEDNLADRFQLILYCFESFRERENWGKELCEESLIKIKEAYDRFIGNFLNNFEKNLLYKTALELAVRRFFEIHSGWYIKRFVNDYGLVLIYSNEFESDFEDDSFEGSSSQNCGYSSSEGEFNINDIPSDSSDSD